MSKKTRIGITLLIVLFVSSLASVAFAAPAENGPPPWTGDPDPYACNPNLDCWWTIDVCIDGKTYKVGIYYDPTLATEQELIDDALFWSGIELTIGKCVPAFNYTGRWVHTYLGSPWTCNLVSEAGVDKDTPRFSKIGYVMDTCGEHDIFGPFEPFSGAKYLLCREIKFADGHLGCGNHYDTSIP
jgi:hypothetical protein